MRIGVMWGGVRDTPNLAELARRTRDLEARGFDTLWLPGVFGFDPLVAAAVIGQATDRIEIGTAVVPTYPRHPAALAQQALTTAAACGGRLTLGIGLSHPAVIENLLGLSYRRRASHMLEYVQVLGPLLRGERIAFRGEEYRVELGLNIPDAPPVPLMIAALGERMLEIAGNHAQGTILWCTGPRAIERHIAPRLRAAARAAGRPAPRIVAGMHIALTSKVELARQKVAKAMAFYGQMPSYRAMLEREGARVMLDGMALVGDERALDAGLDRLRDLGVSDFEASMLPVDDETEALTLAYLESRLQAP